MVLSWQIDAKAILLAWAALLQIVRVNQHVLPVLDLFDAPRLAGRIRDCVPLGCGASDAPGDSLATEAN
jgi:hypothetical protein